MAPRVAVMAGGTGGHVFPALAVAEVLRRDGLEVYWVGTPKGMEATLVPKYDFPIEWVRIEGLRGKGVMRLLSAPFRLAVALKDAARIFARRRPAVAIGMGGFASGPGGIMARIMGVPLVIQEQNSTPGLTNRWLARVAARVFEAFPGSFEPARGAIASGNPVRPEICALPAPGERMAGRSGAPRLLVLGGSLGAQVLNDTIARAIARLPIEARPVIRHQAGKLTIERARSAYRIADVAAEILPFIDDMAEAYAWADLVVARAGALTVSELAAAGVGSILVPYPHAVDDHQTGNARYLAAAGAAHLIPQHELDEERLGALIGELLADRPRLVAMAEAARGRARPEAARQIADACLALIGETAGSAPKRETKS